MFNQILTAFQGFFSRSFWFGSFLPAATVAALHLAIVEIAFPGLMSLEPWLTASLGDKATVFTVVVAALIVLAYALTPFTPLVRGILDGRLLPDRLHNRLQADRIPDWRAATENMRAAMADYAAFGLMYRREVPNLWQAAETGDALKSATDTSSIDAAKAAIDNLQAEMRLNRLPERSTAQEAAAALAVALSQNASDLPPGHAQEPASRKLAQARSLLISLIQEAQVEALYRVARMASKYQSFDLLPTRFGDARRLAERYSYDTYRVDFDYVWTRIQMLLPKDDDGFVQRLSDAQSQLNFSVLALVLTLTVPLAWLPILLVTATTPWLFLTIGILSLLVLLFFYELVVQSQTVFGGVVRVVIDKYRLQVLTEIMRQPLPATLAAERIIWGRLQQASDLGNEVDLAFTHEKAS